MRALIKKFVGEERGVVLVETLLAVPVLTIFAVGILEFGNMMWQRQQLQAGVKDAARYWARCRPTDGAGNAFMSCDIATARLIAFTGNPGGGAPRVPGWDEASELSITPTTLPSTPDENDIITVRGTVVYNSGPLLPLVFPQQFTIGYYYQTRYLGW
ncbi:TadE/TadG family type IV pilus assembly protein [Sulfitobacter aestuariivivens]|uniref:Pilus assembly protein n=1 Tax=Sulfitobacter aestuariivivens TaxID=2766981 RepID=A0A927D6M9_9RHOB|nr:TadE/TadG family type IV pilus assembly protein [Sulfitobacter aestuariivivens]MBD3666210.1 pilus assembly protein [Sulfitobacter aestuariivivens]